MISSIFLLVLEIFTAFNSQIPGHMHGFEYTYVGLHGQGNLVPWTWAFALMAVIATHMMLCPPLRKNETTRAISCLLVFFSLWIEIGITLVITGFIPNHFDTITEYVPSIPELAFTLGVWATGFLILTILYKIAVSVKEEIAS